MCRDEPLLTIRRYSWMIRPEILDDATIIGDW